MSSATHVLKHQGPPLAPVAAVYTLLFLGGLYPVTIFGGEPNFPGPWESIDTIAAFFQARPVAVRICAFLQFGAAIPLGIFTASVVSRLQFLGVRAAGTYIALFGGFATAIMMMAASARDAAWLRFKISARRDGRPFASLPSLSWAFVAQMSWPYCTPGRTRWPKCIKLV